MDYNKISHKIDIKFNKKFRHIVSFICIFVVMGIVSPVFAESYSKTTQDKDISFYEKILNYTIPSIKIVNGNCSDYKISLKEVIKQKLNINHSICEAIIDKEFPMLKLSVKNQQGNKNSIKDSESKNNEKNIEIENKNNDIQHKDNLIPFKLNANDILQQKDLKNDKIDNHNPKLKKKLNINNPEVFIYHTHTCESYKPGNAANPDQSVNVCAAGDIIEKELMNNYGICTIHDKTIHDNMYTKSYNRSRITVKKYLKKYKNFKIMIDLHRDSVSSKSAMTLRTNSGNAAKYMFVLDTANPNYKNNLKLMNNLVNISDRLYPNLIRKRKIYIYQHGVLHFNQDLNSNCIVIELGSYINTTQEAKLTAKYLARIIAEYINRE